jgi:hypothetical protein
MAHVPLNLDMPLWVFGNLSSRNKAEAWRPLGYIPNLYLLSKNENKFRMSSVIKLQMYHEILDAMLESVVKLQSKGRVPFSFTYQNTMSTLRYS